MSARRISKSQSALWIYNPALDLIVGCGAWSAPLLLMSYFSLSSNTRLWAVAFYALALFFNYPHYMATIYRAYHRAEDFQKYRIFTLHITALLLVTLLLSHSWVRLLPWIFTIYLTWSPWHYSGQNYGLFMMFARRAGANPSKSTRHAIYGAFVVSYLVLFLEFHTGASNDPLFLSLGIPAIISHWEQLLLGVAFIPLSIFGLSRLARDTGWRKLTPALTLFSSQFLWFLLPAAISLFRGLAIPQSRYSTGVLAVMHSAQYLWITSYYARKEASDTPAQRDWRPIAYFGVLILGGIALFIPGPWLASRAFHHDFTASFLIFTALVNIHHFILDGAIWKLRDGRIAALLLESRQRISDTASETGSRVAAAWSWFVGTNRAARSMRIGLAMALLVWGSIDQARYYLALHSDDLADLQRAVKLNAFDAPLQLRLGRRELQDGQEQAAEAAFRKAIQSNPADPSAKQALLKLLIEQKRFDEALTLTNAALKSTPKDANLLLDRGLLQMQVGNNEAAITDWNKSIDLDPKQSLAHLYLANELDREGKAHDAAAHYKTFLELIAHDAPQARPSADLVIGIVLRMADCQARSSQTDLAVKSYALAQTLSARASKPKLESIASVNQAALQARSGKLDEALQGYQHALQLDNTSSDDLASAQDWFSYGHFLQQSGFPDRLAYACILKSESFMKSVKNEPLAASLHNSREQLERRLDAKLADGVRRDLDSVLHEALIFRR